MKFLSLIAFLFALPLVAQSKPAGEWDATLHANKDLRLHLHVEQAGTDEFRATITSLDQSTEAIPVTAFWLQKDQVILTVRNLGGSFQGTVNTSSQTITGYWMQGTSLPLTFTRTK